MFSYQRDLVFFVLSVLFALHLCRICVSVESSPSESRLRTQGHSLLQLTSSRSEFGCELSPRELQRFSIGDEGHWLVTESGLEALEGDIQSLVNCTEEGDVLMFDVEAPVHPLRRIIIPWKLTLSSLVASPRLENGIFSEASRKVTFLCPAVDEGVFLVDANESLLANFVFQNCSLNHITGKADQGIITTANCTRRRNLGTVAFHHLEFEANFLNESAALFVREPSCSSVQIINLRFQNNSCIGTCAASLPSRSEIQNVTLTANRFLEEQAGMSILIAVESGSSTTINRLVASGNSGTIVHADHANLTISSSHIFQNSRGLTPTGHYLTGVRLLQSSGLILNSRFERNTWMTGSSIAVENSSIVIRGTSVIGCNSTNHGGGISLLHCSSVRILDSFIANNSAARNGGGVYSNGTSNLQIENTTFQLSSAVRGGGLYCEEGDLEITRAAFLNNSANEVGGGLYFSGDMITVNDSNFTNNGATTTGGGGYIEHSSYSLTGLTLIGNGADDGGAVALMDSSGTLNNSHFKGNSVQVTGGGVYMIGQNTSVVHNCTFTNNSAYRGGGLYLDKLMHASVQLSRFVQNRAVNSGGGARFANGDYTLEGNNFEENEASYVGGGLSGINSTLNVSDTRFINNNASAYGGGCNVFGNTSAWFTDCTWENNSAWSSGGGAFIRNVPALTITASVFTYNQAEFGAVAYVTNSTISFLDITSSNNLARRSAAVLYFMESVGIVSHCMFARNIADWGGVFFLYNSEASIFVSSFVSNEASDNGGAIRCGDSSNLTIENSSFVSNSADQYGGAIHVTESLFSLKNLRFQNNMASQLGGAVHLQRNSSASLLHTVFFNESSGEHGGAISAKESALRLRNISIASCSSEMGGGIFLDRSSASINETSVTFCEASASGGGIGMFESNVTGHGLNILLNRAVGTLRHESNGGGIAIDSSSRLSIRHAILEGNRAHFGAGIYVSGECIVRLLGGRFQNNSASNGGAAYIEDSIFTSMRVTWVRNSAFYGGSLYVFSSNMTLNRSQLINSSSTHTGGSILAERCSAIAMEGTTIQSSSASNGGGIMLIGSNFSGVRVKFRDCSAREHGGSVGLNESSSILCTDCLFEGNSALQEGGALRLESLEPQSLAFQLANNVFRNNDAAFGGAIHFQTGDGSANCSGVNNANCTFLALTGCAFVNNRASFAGGAILSNNPDAIRVSCDPLNTTNLSDYYTVEEFSTLSEVSSLKLLCGNWMENNATIYGPVVASYARQISTTIVFCQNRTVEVKNNRYVLHDHQSGVPLPTISLEAVDEFGQGPALIQDNQLIEAVMTSRNGLFAGVFIVRMEDSRGQFSGITVYHEPGKYEIQINFSERAIATVTIVVEIRQCIIGEWKVANGTLCELCSGDTYNFHPLRKDEGCSPCPDDARCDSRAIRPKKGFWHQTPCSNHVQLCLSEIACNEKGRDARLFELGSSIENCTFDDDFVGNYSEALCREGYTGPLCGSCKASHGKMRSFRCEECYEKSINICLVVFVASVLLGLSAFSIRIALPARKRQTRRPRSRFEESSSSTPVNLQMVEMWCSGIVPPEVKHPHLRTQRNDANIAAAAQQRDQRNVELAKWKATEIFKITINYLQVIAIAIAVNVVWSGALIALFETAGNTMFSLLLLTSAVELIGGVSSEAAGRSTDCLTSADALFPRSGISAIVKLMTPAVVIAICVVFWSLTMAWNQHEYRYLIKRSLLSVVVVSDLAYIAVTKTAVNVFYCVEVYDSVELGVSSTTRYWAVDTALKCYDGSHNVLAFAFGLPVLVMFSFGFPVLIAYVLIKKRSQEGIQSPWLFETAGFLYRSYDSNFVFWESVILLRKAALAAIVVFAYPLGGNLQGILAVCVLVVALHLHLHCRPYRSEFEVLNRLEGLSLLISSLTFASGLFFNDDRTSPEARSTIAAFVIFANVGIFIYFSVRFFVAGATYFGIVLENEGVPCPQNATALYKVKTYLKNRFDEHLVPVLSHINVFKYRQPEDSNPSDV